MSKPACRFASRDASALRRARWAASFLSQAFAADATAYAPALGIGLLHLGRHKHAVAPVTAGAKSVFLKVFLTPHTLPALASPNGELTHFFAGIMMIDAHS
jgi:hypothetical protein